MSLMDRLLGSSPTIRISPSGVEEIAPSPRRLVDFSHCVGVKLVAEGGENDDARHALHFFVYERVSPPRHSDMCASPRSCLSSPREPLNEEEEEGEVDGDAVKRKTPLPRRRVVVSVPAPDRATAETWEREAWNHLLKDYIRLKNKTTRHFLVFVNPFSGKGEAKRIFERDCLPVFTDANIRCTVINTQYAGHAAEMVMDERRGVESDITRYDAVVICSGDGLLFEVVQGIMRRKDWRWVLRHVALGVLPGGSGNGLAVSLASNSGEVLGPTSNAFLIAKGHVGSMDLCAVDHFSGGRFYSFLSLEYGFIADVDLESEWMRSLGDVRFTIQVVRRLLFSPRRVKTRFSWVTARLDDDVDQMEGGGMRDLEAGWSTATKKPVQSYWERELSATSLSATTLDDIERQGETPPSEYVPPQMLYLPPRVSDPLPPALGWHTLTDYYYLMWHVNVSHMSRSSVVSPSSRPGDGAIHLTALRKGRGSRWARVKLLEYMLGLETGAHLEADDVEVSRALAYRIEPDLRDARTSHASKMAVDGERVEMGPVQVEILPKICLVMGLRGD